MNTGQGFYRRPFQQVRVLGKIEVILIDASRFGKATDGGLKSQIDKSMFGVLKYLEKKTR